MKKEIFDAYETIKPDEAAKERMLANILAADSSMSFNKKKETNMKKWKTKYKLELAAALSLVLVIPAAAAYATNLFGLRDMGIGQITIEDPLKEETEREVDAISLQGMSDSPEAMACAEWTTFYEEYDKDGKIISEIGNEPTGIDPRYGEAYNCYTHEMKDKVDEICEKYQLSILEGCEIANTYEDLCSRSGIGNVCRGASENTINTPTGGYFYEDGTLQFEGTVTVAEPAACMTDYQFCRSVKGSFCSTILNIGNADDYEQWEYTTVNGDRVSLANSDAKALIIAERDESFIVVNVLGNIMEDTFDVTNEALESLADSFDFSVIP